MDLPQLSAPKARPLHVLGALLIVYFVWGSTYLGIRIAQETLPPFFQAGTRYLGAGILAYGGAILAGAARPSREHWLDAGIIGALLLLGGNGVVSWAERLVPSSIAALMIATAPMWMLVMGMVGRERVRPSVVTLAGLLLGFVGIGVLVWPSAGAGALNVLGLAALALAAFFWALGSIRSRHARVPASPLLAVAMQMIVGGGVLVLVSGLVGEWARLDPARISSRSAFSMGYLVLIGSVLGYSAYIWLLKNADPVLVSTYAFVNPVVAVFLGWLLANEPITTRTLWATMIIVLSVFVLTLNQPEPGAQPSNRKEDLPCMKRRDSSVV